MREVKMARYHINKNGVPSVCKAKPGNCPYGGQDGNENHFSNIEDAQKAADNSKLINNINQKQVNPVNLVNSHSSRKHQPYTCQRRNFVSSILA